MGHQVRLAEIDAQRLDLLRQGGCPIYEPGLAERLEHHLDRNLAVTGRLDEAVDGARVLMACVGTPPGPGGAPDLAAVRRLVQDLRGVPRQANLTLVMKSTVPPGTCRMAFEALSGQVPVVSNPEFLREGSAIADFFHPDRVVVGSPDTEAALLIAGLYKGVEAPLLLTGWEEAELVKYVTNGFLAVKISFANEVAALCDGLHTDAEDVLQGLGLDRRVGPQFLRPGPGYGGSCLPKDLRALAWKARLAGVRLDLLPAAERVNTRQRHRLQVKLTAALGGLSDKTVAVWGLTFKAGTDDLRSAASLEIIPKLLGKGAAVQAFDPVAMEGFARQCPVSRYPGLTLVSDLREALRGADALLVLTEWDVFRTIIPAEMASLMRGNVVVDGRNLLDAEAAVAAGLVYHGVGRGRVR